MNKTRDKHYSLMVRFSEYPGNFEREFVEYVIGGLSFSEEEMGCGEPEFERLFDEDIPDDFDKEKFHDTYLCYSAQDVDDTVDDTFYNITSHPSNEKWDCDSLFIQFEDEFVGSTVEDMVVERIRKFVNDSRVKELDKSWMKYSEIKILSVELYGKDDELIKTYEI